MKRNNGDNTGHLFYLLTKVKTITFYNLSLKKNKKVYFVQDYYMYISNVLLHVKNYDS